MTTTIKQCGVCGVNIGDNDGAAQEKNAELGSRCINSLQTGLLFDTAVMTTALTGTPLVKRTLLRYPSQRRVIISRTSFFQLFCGFCVAWDDILRFDVCIV